MPKKILTRDEEADEIVRRLSAPPVKRFGAGWTMESIGDFKSLHGLDLEEEMIKVIAAEITAEIDKELLRNLGVRIGNDKGTN